MTDELSISPMEVDRQVWVNLLAANTALRGKLETAEGNAQQADELIETLKDSARISMRKMAEVWELKDKVVAENAALREKLEKAERERDALDRALQSLTVGGSEYVNDPERCVAAVRERFRRALSAARRAGSAGGSAGGGEGSEAMSEKKHDDGGPAYPHDADYVRGGKPGKYIFKVPFAPGMTLLDAFAMEAMVALMEGSSCWDVSDETQVAKKAYSIARAMVVEKRRLEAKR